MEDRIEKTFKELDASSVDFKSGNWSWSRGGHPLQDNEYAISYYDGDLTEIRYKLPKCINEMLRRQYEHGENETKREIQRALGL